MSSQNQNEEWDAPGPDTFRFLITTDNHLGYMDRDPIRKHDSFIAFEECLKHGIDAQSDAVLLAGDFFHDNKPTLSTVTHTMSLLRKYCFGSKDIEFELLSDPRRNFQNKTIGKNDLHGDAFYDDEEKTFVDVDPFASDGDDENDDGRANEDAATTNDGSKINDSFHRCGLGSIANFQDPNINVALPIFMIHGNHDDPMGGYSSIDLLQTAGLVNYFGRVENADDIVVRPILLKKGQTRIALYGMGNVRDERLYRAFRHGKVQFVRPRQEPNEPQWFSILLLHQNRGFRTSDTKNGISEDFLKGFGIDLVIWGNEHEPIITPTSIEGCDFDVIQPGSSIHTAIPNALEKTPAPKVCGILEVTVVAGEIRYKLEPHQLKCVRPIITKHIVLNEVKLIPGRVDGAKVPLPPLPPGGQFNSEKEMNDYRAMEQKAEVLHKDEKKVEEFLRKEAKRIFEDYHKQFYDRKDIPELKKHVLRLPLVRISVDFAGKDENDVPYPDIHLLRLGNEMINDCANPADLFKRITATEKALAKKRAEIIKMQQRAAMMNNNQNLTFGAALAQIDQQNALIRTGDIRDKISSFLKANSSECGILSEVKIAEAVYNFAEKGEKHAIDSAIDDLIVESQRDILSKIMKNEIRDLRVETNNNNNNNNSVNNINNAEIPDINPDRIRQMALSWKMNQNTVAKQSHVRPGTAGHAVQSNPDSQSSDILNNAQNNNRNNNNNSDDANGNMMMMNGNNNNNSRGDFKSVLDDLQQKVTKNGNNNNASATANNNDDGARRRGRNDLDNEDDMKPEDATATRADVAGGGKKAAAPRGKKAAAKPAAKQTRNSGGGNKNNDDGLETQNPRTGGFLSKFGR